MRHIMSGRKSLFALMSVVLLPASLLCGGPAQADIYRSVDRNGTPVFTNVLPAEGRWKLYLREKSTTVRAEPAYDARRLAVDSRSLYAGQIQAAATANNIDAALIRAVISAESGYNPSAVSRKGAIGLMQLMPQTASRYNVANARDPAQNIHGGARYLRDLLTLFNNDVRLAVAAYNAGEQAVVKYGNRIPPYRETIAYVPKVMNFYESYRSGRAVTATSGYRRAASTATISYRRVASSAAGTVSYQRVSSTATANYQRVAAAAKKNAARPSSGVVYLSNPPS
jgi:soluble lytic murein transglycosylase-like protein